MKVRLITVGVLSRACSGTPRFHRPSVQSTSNAPPMPSAVNSRRRKTAASISGPGGRRNTRGDALPDHPIDPLRHVNGALDAARDLQDVLDRRVALQTAFRQADEDDGVKSGSQQLRLPAQGTRMVADHRLPRGERVEAEPVHAPPAASDPPAPAAPARAPRGGSSGWSPRPRTVRRRDRSLPPPGATRVRHHRAR